MNLSPSSAIRFKTPFEMWGGKLASYGNLKALGCSDYVHIRQRKRALRALKRGIHRVSRRCERIQNVVY